MITSTNNPQVKYIVGLQKKAKFRREERRFIIEGIRMFSELPADSLVKAYVTESFFDAHRELFHGVPYEMVTDHVFQHMSDTKTPQGVLAVVSMKEYTLSDILEQENAFIVACEGLQDPGNLGTIVRAGEGAGVTGIILAGNTVDIYNPKTIRSTMGSIYRVPIVAAEDFCMAVKMMKNKGITIAAAHLKGNMDYIDACYGEKSAFLIGNEGNGLSDEASGLADIFVKIPMKGQVESLNAAVAATILMYDAAAKRRH